MTLLGGRHRRWRWIKAKLWDLGERVLGFAAFVLIIVFLVDTFNPQAAGKNHGIFVRSWNQAVWLYESSDATTRSAEAARDARWGEALSILKEALQAHPENAELLYQTAGAYVGLDQPLLAAVYFRAYLEANDSGIEFFDWDGERYRTAWLAVQHIAEMTRQQALDVRTAIGDLAAAIPVKLQKQEALDPYEALVDPPDVGRRGGSKSFVQSRLYNMTRGPICLRTRSNCPVHGMPGWIKSVGDGVIVSSAKMKDSTSPCCRVALDDPVLTDLAGAIDAIGKLPAYQQPRAMYHVFSKLAFMYNALLTTAPRAGRGANILPSFPPEGGITWSQSIDVQRAK